MPKLFSRSGPSFFSNNNLQMKKPVLFFALPALASASILAPSSAHAALSFPIYFPSQTGGFSSPFTTAPGSTNVSASFTGAGSGTTASFNPFANGVKGVRSLRLNGIISYNGTLGSSVVANLLSNGSLAQSFVLASGNTGLNSSPFSLDFTKATNDNINSDLAFQFLGQGTFTSAHPTLTVPVQSVPGPLPILGAAAAFGFSRKLRKRLKSSKSEVISTTAL